MRQVPFVRAQPNRTSDKSLLSVARLTRLLQRHQGKTIGGLHLETSRPSPTTSLLEFPPFALDVRFLRSGSALRILLGRLSHVKIRVIAPYDYAVRTQNASLPLSRSLALSVVKCLPQLAPSTRADPESSTRHPPSRFWLWRWQ